MSIKISLTAKLLKTIEFTIKVICNKYSETCSGLPADISHLTTEASFPISYGTEVLVSCSEGRELRGDNLITCNQDTEFQFQYKPKCNDAGV